VVICVFGNVVLFVPLGGNEMIDGERRRDNCSCKDVVGKIRGAVDCSTQGKKDTAGINSVTQLVLFDKE
jgi:hypothetical protein